LVKARSSPARAALVNCRALPTYSRASAIAYYEKYINERPALTLTRSL
jgi:hypothetical protein